MKSFLSLGFLFSAIQAQNLKFFTPQVFPAKDLNAFLNNEGDLDEAGISPVNTALLDEEVFFVQSITVFQNQTGETFSWSLSIDGQVVFEDPAFVIPSANFQIVAGDEDGAQFKLGSLGGATFLTEFSDVDGQEPADKDQDDSTRVWVITGFASVLPLLLIVIFALMSRNVYVAMFFGIWIGSLIIEEGDLEKGTKELFDTHMIPSITDDFNFRTIVFTLFLGGFLAMIKRAGGQDGFSQFIGRYARSAKSTQIAAVIVGFGLFFDDYSSVLILGAAFKELMDKYHVSREKLAFVADATSAPIASVAPISSWIAFELGLIKAELENIQARSNLPSKDDLDSEYNFFLSTIPSRYYPFFMLTVQVTLIIAGVEFGPMLYAERRTRLGLRTDGGDARMEIPLEVDYTTPADDTPRKAWNFFIPLGFFLSILLASLINIGKDGLEDDEEVNLRNIFGATDSFAALVYTTMGASLFALVFFLIQFKKDGEIIVPNLKLIKKAIDCRLAGGEELAKEEGIEPQIETDEDKETGRPIMYFTEGVNIWVEGFKNLVPAILVLCLAFTVKSIVTGLATDRLFTDIILNSDIDAGSLPTIIFIISALLAIATGTSFGTMSIMFPLISFATFEKSNGDIDIFTVALSSIMAGAVFGDHSSPISDTTILSSIGSGCQIGAHVYTQIPYAIWAGVFSIILGTLPAGYGANAVAMLLIGMIIVAVFTILVAAPIVAASGRLDMFSELALRITGSETLRRYKEQTKVFAEEQPQLVDYEVSERLVWMFPFLGSCCGKLIKKSPFVNKMDTVAELEAIADGSKFNDKDRAKEVESIEVDAQPVEDTGVKKDI